MQSLKSLSGGETFCHLADGFLSVNTAAGVLKIGNQFYCLEDVESISLDLKQGALLTVTFRGD